MKQLLQHQRLLLLCFILAVTDLGEVKGAGDLPSAYRWGHKQDVGNQTQPAPSQEKHLRLKFSGEVSRGQAFEKEIGHNLIFRLIPWEHGWFISVGGQANADRDFAEVVTPPYRGVNELQIAGWHFRNADNSGPNKGDVNAPQEIREFRFVLNKEDYNKASDALERMLWPYQYSEEQIKEAEKIHGELKTAKGVLTIKDMRLGNLEMGPRAWFEYMKFEVELYLPPDFKL